MNRSGFGFLAFIVAIVIGIVFVWPEAAAVRSATTQEQAKISVSSDLQTKLTALNELSQTFATNTNEVNSLVSILPQTPEVPETLVSVEAMAQASGISVVSLTPQVDTANQDVTLNLSGSGSSDSVNNFLTAVASNNRPISVNSVSLTPAPDGKNVTITIGLVFPYRATTTGGS
jgi:Tfp pilus assembly protein PilO